MRQRAGILLCLALVLGPAGHASAKLVAHWKLDETSGTVAKDASGNGYNGTLIGGTTWVTGTIRGALEVNGSTGYVDFGNPPDWPAGRSPRSLCGWGKTDTVAAGYRWMAAYGSPNTSQAMFIGLNGSTLVAGGYGGDDVTVANGWRAGEWQHVTLTYDGTTARAYTNGVQTGALAKTWNLVLSRAHLGRQVNTAAEFWDGAIDDVRLYDHVLDPAELPAIMAGVGLEQAQDPLPADEATDVPQDVVLGWTAGKFAATHDVYLGTTLADVNDASRASPAGVLASRGQADTAYDSPTLLEFGRSYYWRIDEVNAAPDNTIFKGQTWSFTAEPFSYRVTPKAVTASSVQPGMVPENTINGSGLNANDEHSAEPTQMWMSTGTPQPNWIQYEFDQVYQLDKLWVWNSNQLIEGFLGFGARNVTIEYSVDGAAWTALADVPEFARAPGTAGYRANTVVDFGGVRARFVKLTITQNWGGVAPQTGLAEVRFFYVPVQAFYPEPAAAATDVSVATELNWRPGREATSHQVLLGTDPSALAPVGTATEHRLTPAALNLGTTYYWRVDELGGGGPYEGKVWSFTTEPYATVDDFESYTDKAGEEVFAAWVDGFDNPAKNGAIVGLATAVNGTYCATSTFHGGKASMPFAYDNTQAPLSEATLTLAQAQDWTASGIKSLSLWFQGTAGSGGQLYVKINNTKVLYDGDAGDLKRTGWQVWNIDLSQAGAVGSVRSLTLGVEGAGATGVLYVDDIRLYPRAPEYIIPVQPAAANLVGYYTLDEGSGTRAGDSSGKGHHGTVNGNPQWVAGMVGGALALDGSGDYVEIPNPADWPAGAAARSMCAWARTQDLTAVWHWIVAYGSPSTSQAMFIGANGTALYGGGYGNDVSLADFWEIGVWHHIALTYDGATARLYADGVEVAAAAKTWNLVRSQARIGQQVNNLNEFWQGTVDDVRIYNTAISAAEVAGLSGQTQPRHKPF